MVQKGKDKLYEKGILTHNIASLGDAPPSMAMQQLRNRYYGAGDYNYDGYYGDGYNYDDLYDDEDYGQYYDHQQQLVYMNGYIAGYKAAKQKDKAISQHHNHKSLLRRKYRN